MHQTFTDPENQLGFTPKEIETRTTRKQKLETTARKNLGRINTKLQHSDNVQIIAHHIDIPINPPAPININIEKITQQQQHASSSAISLLSENKNGVLVPRSRWDASNAVEQPIVYGTHSLVYDEQ